MNQQLVEQPKKQAIAPRLDRPRTIVELAKLVQGHKSKIVSFLPAGIDGESVLKKAILAVQNQPELLRCSPGSLFWAIAEAVQSGLEIGGVRAHAYIVPYANTATLLLGYKGMIELVRRTGQLADATMELVHEGDRFEFEQGDNPRLVHTPSADPDAQTRPVTHVYVIFRLTNGSKVRNVWTAARVNSHRDAYSEAYRRAERYRQKCVADGTEPDPKKLSPWHTAWHVQAWKTLVRDSFNRGLLPISESIQATLARETAIESCKSVDVPREAAGLDAMLSGILGDVSEVPRELPPPPEQTSVSSVDVIEEDSPRDSSAATGVGLTIQDALARCVNLGQLTAVRERFLAEAADTDEADGVRMMCDERAAEIREARGK